MAQLTIGNYNDRRRRGGGWKAVFAAIVLLHLLGVGIYLYTVKSKGGDPGSPGGPLPPSAPAVPAPAVAAAPTPETRAVLADARAVLAAGQPAAAKEMLEKLVASTPDPEAVKLLGDVNMKLLKSPLMMPGKEYYLVVSGDYLQKIARKFNTTVELLKTMNGLETDMIRLGSRLLVFNGTFSIRVSKSRNELDLLLDGRLFKRYPVGTGKFGKTPASEFLVVDKIVEPPWTRPSDNRQIEYGDPENVLGTRWMALRSPTNPELTGFGIHGTWERDSIGKQSSAGCVRLLNEDVEELFDIVPRQTKVVITD